MCTMDVHPHGRSVDQMQAMTHNVMTDLGNVELLRPILATRDPEALAQLIAAGRALSKAHGIFLSLYAKYVPDHTHPGNHEGHPDHNSETHGSEAGDSPETLTALADDGYVLSSDVLTHAVTASREPRGANGVAEFLNTP